MAANLRSVQGVEKNIPVLISAPSRADATEQSGSLICIEYNPKELSKRAIKAGAVCVVVGMCSFMIHPGGPLFFMSFLIASPFVAMWVARRPNMVTGGSGICPNCRAEFKIASGTMSWPYSDHCSACHVDVKINPNHSI